MDNELKSAVRRLRESLSLEYLDEVCEVYARHFPESRGYDEDLRELYDTDTVRVAEAYLAEHLPDDDEPASPARYEGPDCVDVVIHADGTAEIERVEELTACIGLPGVYRTRGDVRRLLRGLQMEVKA